MIARETLAGLWPTAPLLAGAGFLLGRFYFCSLRRAIRLSLARHAWKHYVFSALSRVGAAGLFFILAVRCGAPALLAAFAGFLTARHLAVRAAARRPA